MIFIENLEFLAVVACALVYLAIIAERPSRRQFRQLSVIVAEDQAR